MTDWVDDDRVAISNADRTGILIVRLWIETDPVTGLRARITQTLDTTETEQHVKTVSTTTDIYSIVRTWVESFVTKN